MARRELERVLSTGPFPLALRTAIAVRGLGLQRIAHRLAERGVTVGVTSLSYWQQGARTPQRPESLRAVRLLEEVLELPDQALIRLLEGESERAIGAAAGGHHPVAASSATVGRMLAELEHPADGGLHTVVHAERVRIGPRRQLLERTSQHVVRAHRDGVDRYVAIHQGEPGCDTVQVVARAVENCRIGRVRRDRATGTVMAELLFDLRLRTGDTYVLGYAFEDGSGGATAEYRRGFAGAGGQYVLQVAFHEAAVPLRCRRFGQKSSGAARTGVRELALSGRHRTVHLAERVTAPGIVGIGWDWT